MNPDLEPITQILPSVFREALSMLEPDCLERLEELRLRAGRPMTAVVDGREITLSVRGSPVMIQPEHLRSIVSGACGQSVYSASEPIAQGYLTLRGGHRLGLCGTAVCTGEEIATFRDFSSLNLRVARSCPGCADKIVQAIRAEQNSVLIIGPPGSGKTTVLRDLIRQLSDRLGLRVSLADERGEVAAVFGGLPQLDIGRHTDVLSGAEKSQAMIRLLRSMNPQFLAVDEISAARDLDALRRACYCGIRLAATAHAYERSELLTRPLYRELMQMGLFHYLVTLRENRTLSVERLENV